MDQLSYEAAQIHSFINMTKLKCSPKYLRNTAIHSGKLCNLIPKAHNKYEVN